MYKEDLFGWERMMMILMMMEHTLGSHFEDINLIMMDNDVRPFEIPRSHSFACRLLSLIYIGQTKLFVSFFYCFTFQMI